MKKLSKMKQLEPTEYVEPNAEDVRLIRIWRIDYDSVCFGLYTYTPAQFHAVTRPHGTIKEESQL